MCTEIQDIGFLDEVILRDMIFFKNQLNQGIIYIQ